MWFHKLGYWRFRLSITWPILQPLLRHKDSVSPRSHPLFTGAWYGSLRRVSKSTVVSAHYTKLFFILLRCLFNKCVQLAPESIITNRSSPTVYTHQLIRRRPNVQSYLFSTHIHKTLNDYKAYYAWSNVTFKPDKMRRFTLTKDKIKCFIRNNTTTCTKPYARWPSRVESLLFWSSNYSTRKALLLGNFRQQYRKGVKFI